MVESVSTRKESTSKTRNCNNHKRSLFDYGEFIGWDGEGVTTPDGKHRYILLMNSLGEEVYNSEGLSTRECFNFLLRSIAPNRIHICFASGYDINKMLKDVSKAKLKELWDSQDITDWATYAMRYRKAKNFWLRDYRGSLTLWDVFSFFQSSFVKAISTYFPEEINNEEVQAIIKMKAKRSQFALENLDSIRYYCALELKWLVKLMERLRENFRKVNLKLSRWDGAGAVASCLLRREGIKSYQSQSLESIVRSLAAYYGGRIETTCVGVSKGPIFQYDLRSAYPSVIRYLPNLKKGNWKKREVPNCTCYYSLHKVEWSFQDGIPFYPLPYRSKNDSILFPRQGRGWYWGVEVYAATEYARTFGGDIHILESWNFYPDKRSKEEPFDFVSEIYDERAKLKTKKDGAEYALKLALNSLYGKMHQQLGGTSERFPTYFQPEWSGYITAATRAKLLRLAIQSPDSILMFATDGLFSRERLDDIKLGDDLGEWEELKHDGIIIVQPGVYYLNNGNVPTCKSRGFGIDALKNPRIIIEGLRSGKAFVPIPTTRFVTLGSALASQKLWNEWGNWRTVDRELCLDGYNAKRNPIPDSRIQEASRTLVFTTPRESRDYQYLDEDSKPFATIWNPDDGLEEEMIDGVPYNIWLHETTTEEYYG